MTSTTETPLQALVIGASGISGWGLCQSLLSYPASTTFSRIIGLTNRTLSLADSGLPTDDPRLTLASGINLLSTAEDVTKQLSEKVPDVAAITHVYFTAYTSAPDFQKLRDINTLMLRNAVLAVDALCPSLQCITLQSGSKWYGSEFSAHIPISTPLVESAPRIPQPWSDNIFYYSQSDLLSTLSSGKRWRTLDIRPDVIIGFVPNGNIMNAAQQLALYLSLYRRVYGAEARVAFPGTQKSWRNTHTDTSQDVLARFSIFASMRSEAKGAYNIADGEKTTWSYKWPKIAEWFGLEGVGPEEGGEEPRVWWGRNRRVYEEMVKVEGLKERELEWEFVDVVMRVFDVDREYDLGKARRLGWEEERLPELGWWRAFEMMREFGVIPRRFGEE
ncbi:hypothetical protein K440DRAFT_654265 [Wilcoxina mikolae CBS 423.85]|nr:hypothetical protein K440DRAFT_654265 [Wilcoxina mikolae CBS 423.85]